MSYAYPLPSRHEYGAGCARALEGLPLCLVENDDGSCELALTGGGMDLSWEICEAFMRLGFLPPHNFADLPRMADRPRTDAQRWVVEGCKAAMRAMIDRSVRYERSIEILDEIGAS